MSQITTLGLPKYFCVLLLVVAAIGRAEQISNAVVTGPEGLEITEQELAYIVKGLPSNLRNEASTDLNVRYEAIAATVATKRIFRQLSNLNAIESSDLFYRFQFAILAAAKEVDEKRFQQELELPDFEQLAQERYRVSRNEIAVVPEQRMVSHLLLLCSDSCDKEERMSELEAIRQRALAGESFADLAAEFSQDPGTRERGGQLSGAITKDNEKIDSNFRKKTFLLNSPGDISEIVESRFGFHFIRLNKVIPERVLDFDAVKTALIQRVEERYREDAYRDYLMLMGSGDDLVIDRRAVDSAFDAFGGEVAD
jgi:peptidyl-prolyl cis-trans isomerase C